MPSDQHFSSPHHNPAGPDDQYRNLLDNALFPIVVSSLDDHRVLYMNQAARDFFNLAVSTSSTTYTPDLWADPALRSGFIAQIHLIGKSRDFKAHLKTSDGKSKIVLISGTRVVFEGRQAVSSIIKDITAEQKAEKALKKSEHEYHELYSLMRLMCDTVPDLIWAKDLDDNYLFANKTICEKLLMCSDNREPIGKNDIYFAEKERQRGHIHTFGEICVDSDKLVKQTGTPGRYLEDGLVRGKYLVLDVHKAPLFNSSGELIGTVGAGRDVTQDKKTLEEKKASEDRYRLLAENVRDVIWTMDENLNFTYVSPSIYDLFGWSPEEFLNSSPRTHFPLSAISSFARFVHHYQRVARGEICGEGSQFWEFEMVQKSGSRIWTETITSPLHNEHGKFLGVVGVSRDVTQRVETQIELEKAKEEALAASRTKSEFLANMSHEIRTPMNGILGMLQLLQSTSLDEKQRRYVDTALKSGASLLRLISDILDFSKIEAGKIELFPRRFNFHSFLQTVMRSCASLVDASLIDLRLRIEDQVPECIIADESRLQQILFNLLGNAVKFTASGSIQLRVTAKPIVANIFELGCIVEDSGIGIPSSVRDQLFEPFVQADGSFQRKYKGTGLGLSIVKKLVNLMEGEITLHSREGYGTVVKFFFKAHVDTQPEAVCSRLPEQSATLQPSRILVVEDEEINAMVISAMLKNQGHHVTLASNGREAIDLLPKAPYDCILMDIQMPEMDGLETAKAIREQSPRPCVDIPIIAVTAHAMKGDRENFLAAGMDEYITKPVDATALTETLRRVLAGRSENSQPVN